jgi:hypothetical protein
MPGTGSFLVDPATFSTVILLAVEPRLVFGSNTGEHEMTKGPNPTPKWTASVAVTFPANGAMPGGSDILGVTIASATNPGESVAPGTQVILEQLRMGISSPEIRTRKDSDQARVSGGKPFFSAVAVKPAVQQSWSKKSDAA